MACPPDDTESHLHHRTFAVTAACGDSATPGAYQAAMCTPLTAANVDDCLRMNEIQVLGLHNSYCIAPEPARSPCSLSVGGISITRIGHSTSSCRISASGSPSSTCSPIRTTVVSQVGDAAGASPTCSRGARYLMRTRADSPTVEARSGDTTRRDRAFACGAQYVSSDYAEVSPFGSGYIARLPRAEQLTALQSGERPGRVHARVAGGRPRALCCVVRLRSDESRRQISRPR